MHSAKAGWEEMKGRMLWHCQSRIFVMSMSLMVISDAEIQHCLEEGRCPTVHILVKTYNSCFCTRSPNGHGTSQPEVFKALSPGLDPDWVAAFFHGQFLSWIQLDTAFGPFSPTLQGWVTCSLTHLLLSLQREGISELRASLWIWEIQVSGQSQVSQHVAHHSAFPQKKWRQQHTILKLCCRHEHIETREALRYYSNQSHTRTKDWQTTSSPNQ